jgi:hypothetical protein
LKEIQYNKEEIEKLKKNRSKVKQAKKGNNLPSVPYDSFVNVSRGNGSMINANENSEFDLEESEFNNVDKNE